MRGLTAEEWALAGTAIMGVPTWRRLRRGRPSMFTWVGWLPRPLDRDSGELRVQRLPGGSEAVVGFVAGLAGPVRVTYEQGRPGSCSRASLRRSVSTAWSVRRA